MIPALMGKKKAVSIILGFRDEPQKEEAMEEMNSLQVIAEDLISAVESKDASAVADALKAAFSVLEAEEYEEEGY